MRLVHAWTAALLLSAGCGRLGFALHEPVANDAGDGKRPSGMDAAALDGSMAQETLDASSIDGGGPRDAGASDAAPRDASQRDAAADASQRDAAQMMDGMIVTPPDEDSGAAPPETIYMHCPEVPGALFCDSFEADTTDRWGYEIAMNGSATRSGFRTRTGPLALHATTGAAAQDNAARFASTDLAKQKSGEIWMRFWDWLPSSTVITSHFSAGVVSEILPPYAGLYVAVLPNSVGVGGMVGLNSMPFVFPRDEWVCVELHAHVHPTEGYLEVYINGSLAIASAHTNTVPADGFTSAEVGIHYAESTQGPVELWVDDVIIGKKSYGCN